MKKTSKDLMEWLGLQVGDRIKYGVLLGVIAIDEDNEIIIEVYDKKDEYCGDSHLHELIGCEYKILPKPKRVGDLICDCQSCANCPLRMLDCLDEFGNDFADMTLYEILDYKNTECKDQEVYDLFKKRLDKEVE